MELDVTLTTEKVVGSLIEPGKAEVRCPARLVVAVLTIIVGDRQLSFRREGAPLPPLVGELLARSRANNHELRGTRTGPVTSIPPLVEVLSRILLLQAPAVSTPGIDGIAKGRETS